MHARTSATTLMLASASAATLLLAAGTLQAQIGPQAPASVSPPTFPARLGTAPRVITVANNSGGNNMSTSGGSVGATPPAPLPYSVSFATGGSFSVSAAGMTLSDLQAPVVADNNKLAFVATIAGAGVSPSNNTALIAANASSSAMILRTGVAIPGMPSGSVNTIDDLYVAASGHVAVMTRFNDSSTTVVGINKALLRFNPNTGAMETVARTGSSAPGYTNGRFKDISLPSLSASGKVMFGGSVSATGVWAGQDRALWSDASGSLNLVAKQLGNVPGMSATTKFASLGMGAMNDNGQVAFIAFLQGTGINATNDACVFTTNAASPGSNMTLVARRGTFITGASGPTFRVFNAPAINNAGDIAFMGTIDGAGTGTFSNIFKRVATTGNTSGLIRTGLWSSPLPANTVWGMYGSPVMGGNGQMAFLATINGPSVTQDNDIALYTADSAGVHMVAREGSAAPGLSPAVFSSFMTPAINNRGQLLFTATLTGPGVSAANNTAAFTYDPILGLKKIVRTGETVSVNGANKAVTDLRFSGYAGGQDGRASGISPTGNFAVLAKFLDGSAILTGQVQTSSTSIAAAQ